MSELGQWGPAAARWLAEHALEAPGTIVAGREIVIRRRQARAQRTAREIEHLAGLDIPEFLERLEQEPRAEEMLATALEEGARAVWEPKRRALARAAAAAIRGDRAAVEEAWLLQRAVVAIDEPYVQLMTLIAQARDGRGQMAGRPIVGGGRARSLCKPGREPGR